MINSPIFAGAAISGLFAIFQDGTDYFRIKNIPDEVESREILGSVGLEVYGSVDSIKSSARGFYLRAVISVLWYSGSRIIFV
ncbi:MAG: hypothetical protein WCC17_16495 [Candidatus Nitrosopolaris sp.]